MSELRRPMSDINPPELREPASQSVAGTYVPSGESQWDGLLAKYVQVWVWSILFGATTGLSYAYLGVRFDRPWGSLAALPLLIMIVGIAAALGAWYNLLLHLRVSILPTLFGLSRRLNTNDPMQQEWVNRRAKRSIVLAYKFLILTGMARLLLALTDLMFQVLKSGF